MKELIGKTIKSITVYGEYQGYIKFATDGDDVWFSVSGDCCSESYFSEIWCANHLIGKKVVEVKDISLEPGEAPFRPSRQDSDSIYGIHIKVENEDGPVATIIFRNSSNGYYGGDIGYCEAPKDEEILSKEFKVESENWSAPSL